MYLQMLDIAERAAIIKRLLALRKTDPETLAYLLALQCVKRGRYWLHQNAAPYWPSLLFCIREDSVACGIRTVYPDTSALVLSFQYDKRFVDPQTGYVEHYKVIHGLGLRFANLYRLGFDIERDGYAPFRKKHPGIVITPELIDQAWHKTLRQMEPGFMRYRHQTALERRFLEETFLEKPSIWQRIRNWFRGQDPSFSI